MSASPRRGSSPRARRSPRAPGDGDDAHGGRRSPRDRAPDSGDGPVARLRSTLDVRTADLRDEREAARTLEERIAEQKAAIDALVDRLQRRDGALRDAQEDREQAPRRLGERRARAARLQEQAERLSQRLRDARASAEGQARLEAENRALEAECRGLARSLHALHADFAEREARALREDEEAAGAEAAVERLRAAEAELRWPLERADALAKERAALLRARDAADADNAGLRGAADAAAAKFDDCIARLDVQTELVRALTAELDGYSRENVALKKQVAELQARLGRAHRATAELLKGIAGEEAGAAAGAAARPPTAEDAGGAPGARPRREQRARGAQRQAASPRSLARP
jgi:chromosome segregation ATPase